MIKRVLAFCLKALVSVGLVWWAVGQTDFASVLATMNRVHAASLILATALAFGHVLLGAIKWDVVLRALSCRLPFLQTFNFYYASLFFTQVLPGAVATDAMRAFMAARAGVPVTQAVSSVVLERLATVYVLLLLVSAMLPLLLMKVPEFPWPWLFPTGAVVATVGILVVSQLNRLPASWHHNRAVRGLAAVATDTRRVLLHPVFAAGSLGFALLSHLNLALLVFVLAWGANVDITLLDCLTLVPPVIFLTLLPVSVAGWGVREFSMIAALGFVGVDASAALAISLLLGVVTLISTLPGALIFVRLRGVVSANWRKDGVGRKGNETSAERHSDMSTH